MSSQPPKIDQRTYDDLVRQTAELVSKTEIEVNGEYKKWSPPADKQKPDPGWALIRIFARMAALVSDRLNQVPEKNFLTFLDLLGGQLYPPQPARVPLTFYLSEGSTSEAVVPPHTQISAPPAQDNAEEVVFETAQKLVVTTAQLQAVFVRQPDQDKYQDCTDAAIGKNDQSFRVFEADSAIEHHLYIACEEIFSLSDLKDVKLTFKTASSADANLYNQLRISWWYWDGKAWEKTESQPQPTVKETNWEVTFPKLPLLVPCEINGMKQRWLRASSSKVLTASPNIETVEVSVTVKSNELAPDVCLFNSMPLDLSKDFYPFGTEPALNDTFYLLLQAAFIKSEVKITIAFEQRSEKKSSDLKIIWEYGDGQNWIEIEDKDQREDSKIQNVNFTKTSHSASFKLDKIPAPSTVNGKTGYWLRARITNGFYGQNTEPRSYVIFDEVAIVNKVIKEDSSKIALEIAGSAEALFKQDETVRLVWSTNKLEKILEDVIENLSGNKLTLKTGSVDARAIGARVLRKRIVSEPTIPIHDPPLIKFQSLKLNYEFTLAKKAVVCVNNDFIYSHKNFADSQQAFSTTLSDNVAKDSRRLTLEKLQGLACGDSVVIQSPPSQSASPQSASSASSSASPQTASSQTASSQTPPMEKYHQIEKIDPEKKQVTLKTPLIQDYEKGSTLMQVFCPFTPSLDQNPTLYLGFNQPESLDQQGIPPFNNKPVTLYAEAESPSAEDSLAISNKPETVQIVWEYSSPTGWSRLPGVRDETQAFFQRGLIQFIGPPGFSKQSQFGQNLYWLRVRWTGGNFLVKPRLRRLLTNTTWAVQAVTLRQEVLGSSNGDRDQVFFTSQAPVLEGQQLEVQEGDLLTPEEQQSIRQYFGADAITVIQGETGKVEAIWVRWQEVPDFYSSQAKDRHYVLDRQTGRVQFGDGQSGMIPPRGMNNIRMAVYRTGGGVLGNKAAQTITQLKTTIPYVDRVINLEASGGGAEQEELEHLKERVPKWLRHRDRAVTQQDFEDLAYAASTEVARVKVNTPDGAMQRFDPLLSANWLDPKTGKPDQVSGGARQPIPKNPSQIKVIVVPNSRDRQPIPSLALLKQVETYLRDRCEPGVDLIVTGPRWQKVSVATTIVPVSLEQADAVRYTVMQRLDAFLHPLSGGRGDGWTFGRYPHQSDLYALIQSVTGVDHVRSLTSDPGFDASGKEIQLDADCFIYSGSHTVTVTGGGV